MMLTEVTKDNFDQEVLISERPVLVDFWAPNCANCLALMPAVEKIAEKYADKLRVVKMNTVGNRLFCMKLKVMGLPTFIIYKDGKEVKRLTGEVTKENIEKAIGEAM